MTAAEFRQAVLGGRTLLGTFLNLGSAMTAEVAGRTGFDWLLLDHEHGRSKMSGAAQVRAQAERVLALDPTHPGASYMLGRIHASVLRMGGFKRFMAKQLFGGEALEGASWEAAQSLLEVAVRGAPCIPEHHFELARVYAQRGDAAAAAREIASVRQLTAGREGPDARLLERAEHAPHAHRGEERADHPPVAEDPEERQHDEQRVLLARRVVEQVVDGAGHERQQPEDPEDGEARQHALRHDNGAPGARAYRTFLRARARGPGVSRHGPRRPCASRAHGAGGRVRRRRRQTAR